MYNNSISIFKNYNSTNFFITLKTYIRRSHAVEPVKDYTIEYSIKIHINCKLFKKVRST